MKRVSKQIDRQQQIIDRYKDSLNFEDLVMMNEAKGRLFRYQDNVEKYKTKLIKYREKVKYTVDALEELNKTPITSNYIMLPQ